MGRLLPTLGKKSFQTKDVGAEKAENGFEKF